MYPWDTWTPTVIGMKAKSTRRHFWNRNLQLPHINKKKMFLGAQKVNLSTSKSVGLLCFTMSTINTTAMNMTPTTVTLYLRFSTTLNSWQPYPQNADLHLRWSTFRSHNIVTSRISSTETSTQGILKPANLRCSWKGLNYCLQYNPSSHSKSTVTKWSIPIN